MPCPVGTAGIINGILSAVALTAPVLTGIALGAWSLVSLASFGAMFALFVAPRHEAAVRIAGIGIAGVLVVLSAGLGLGLRGQHVAALVLLFLFSWLAALPRPEQAYLGLMVKYMASAMLLTDFGFSPSLPMAGAFLSGLALGTVLSLAGMPFEARGEITPWQEFQALVHGATNSRLFGMAVPVTVLGATLIARSFHFSDPAWVGLTVLYVMHSDGATELFRIWARALGTLAGVLVSALILYATHNPLHIAAAIALAAFGMSLTRSRYLVFSFCVTCVVLLLIDISMFRAGGDFSLLRWRFIDTIVAGACVLVSNLTLRLIRKWRGQD